MQAQISTAFSRLVSAANAVNTKALSLSTALAMNVGSVASLSTVVAALPSGGGGGGAQPRMYVRDEKTHANGGSAVVGLNDRDLNTVVYNTITGASLASNVITLPAGTYYVRARSTGHRTEHTRLLICDASNNEIARGPVCYSPSGGVYTSVNPECVAYPTFTATTGIKLRQDFFANAAGSLAKGIAIDVGIDVYSEVEIIKL